MGQPSANQRDAQSDPERQPGDNNFGSRNSEVDRDSPEDDREGDECRRRRQQADRVGVGQWVIEFRDNNWIYIKDKGWVEFDEKIIRWIR